MEKEQKGELPHRTFLQFLLTKECVEPNKQRELLNRILKIAPDYPPALLEQARKITDKNTRLLKLEQIMKLEHDSLTNKDIIILQATTLHEKGLQEEACKLLDKYCNDPSVTSGLYKLEVDFYKHLIEGKIAELNPELKN